MAPNLTTVTLDEALQIVRSVLPAAVELDTGHIASIAKSAGVVINWNDASSSMSQGNLEVARQTIHLLPQESDGTALIYNLDTHDRQCGYLAPAQWVRRPDLFFEESGVWIFRPETIIIVSSLKYVYLLHSTFHYTEFMVADVAR
jgi:hypothetical protein